MNTPEVSEKKPLSAGQLEQYHRDGFIVVENLLSADEMAGLQERVQEYTHGGRPPGAIKIQVEPSLQPARYAG
jgi:hypothetical protein